jgi:hypothetical protein
MTSFRKKSHAIFFINQSPKGFNPLGETRGNPKSKIVATPTGLNVKAPNPTNKIQKGHHKTATFYDELKQLLIEIAIECDEKYLL